MANRAADTLFQLIRSLEKSEKRHFKLYIKRNSANSDLKIVKLFDTLDKLPDYDESLLLKKLPGVTKTQLANLKTHLYKQVLASLRLLKTTDNTDLQLSEHLDYARLLYNKGLKLQSLKILEKAKEIARVNQKLNYLAQVISLEKKIETLHITRSSPERAQSLASEALEISGHIERVTKFSNLALLLYQWYIRNGHARNESDLKNLMNFFKSSLPENIEEIKSFYEKLYLYQSYCWYAFIMQDYPLYYRYGQKWIDLFEDDHVMIGVETGHYIKGMHTLMNAHFMMRNYREFDEVLKKFEAFAKTPFAAKHDNFRTHTSIYLNSGRINLHLIRGTFQEGLQIVPRVERKLREHAFYVDPHRILVFNYKIAMLHFGAGKYESCIDYLQRIINGPLELRMDLQCYARLLHLMSHYELGNEELIDSLTKSVYRFMSRMNNLTVVEEEMFKFLRKSLQVSKKEIKGELEKFLKNIKKLENNRFETRSFSYLDVISWAESKVYEKPMSEVVYGKYMNSKRR